MPLQEPKELLSMISHTISLNSFWENTTIFPFYNCLLLHNALQARELVPIFYRTSVYDLLAEFP